MMRLRVEDHRFWRPEVLLSFPIEIIKGYAVDDPTQTARFDSRRTVSRLCFYA
jgi:hypothetical protein